MYKKVWLVIISIMVALALFGCGKKKEADTTYVKTSYWIDGEKVKADSAYVSDKEIYYYTSNAHSEKDTSTELCLYKSDISGTKREKITTISADACEQINSITFTPNNGWNYIMSSDESYSLVMLDMQGKETNRVDLSEMIDMSLQDGIDRLLCDNEGNYYLVFNKKIVVLDANGQLIVDIDTSEVVEFSGFTKDGRFVYESTSVDNKPKVKILNLDRHAFDESYTLEKCSGFQGFVSIDGVYDFYYKDATGILGYQIDNKKTSMVVDYANSSLTEDVQVLDSIDNNRLLALGYDTELKATSCFVLKKEHANGIDERKEIVLAKMDVNSFDYYFSDAINEFNSSNEEYKITIKDYSLEEDEQLALNTDIAAGDIPDIIMLNAKYNNYDIIDRFINLGLLEELTSYFEKDDEIGLNDLLDSVVNTWNHNGGIYYVDMGFSIQSMIMTSKKGKNYENGWDIDSFLDMSQSLDSATKMFYHDDKEDLLRIMLSSGTMDFVNWSTGEVNFDSEKFIQILEFCNAGRGNVEDANYSNEENEAQMFRQGKVCLKDIGFVDCVDLQYYTRRYGTDISFVGYPTGEGSGSYLDFKKPLGISSSSKVKEGAWQFVKMLLSKEKQQEVKASFPVRKDVFEEYLSAMKNSDMNFSDGVVTYTALTEAEEKLLLDVLNKASVDGHIDRTIDEIVWEEARRYFKGDISVHDAARLINDRVSKYVNENR